MRKGQIGIALVCCLPMLVTVAQGQSKQKPGLWETTSQMTISGMPQMPQNMPNSPFAPHTVQVCVTQEMVDKYGGPMSQPQRGDCQVTNISMKPDGMTAEIMCTGQMSAKGDITTKFTDGNSTDMTMHLAGTMQMGQNSRPIDMTLHATSVYKGPDCGSVKPMTVPSGK